MECSTEGNNSHRANEKGDIIYSERIGIRNYTLMENEETKRLIEGIILASYNKLRNLLDSKNISEEERKRIITKTVAEVSVDHMRSGLSVFRVFLGGKYNLQDVLNAVSCIDASVLIQRVLEQGFGISSEIETTRLGVVNSHHYCVVKSNDNNDVIIDPILRSKKNKAGVFYSRNEYERIISIFNSLGMKAVFKQLWRFVKPKNLK